LDRLLLGVDCPGIGSGGTATEAAGMESPSGVASDALVCLGQTAFWRREGEAASRSGFLLSVVGS